jgi:transposase
MPATGMVCSSIGSGVAAIWHLRGLLYEAATVVLTRANADGALRTWGLKLRERIGFKRAAVEMARKMAVIVHAI